MEEDIKTIIKKILDEQADHAKAIENLNRRLTALEKHVEYWDTVTDNNLANIKRDIEFLNRERLQRR